MCDMLPPVETRLTVHVLIHRHEQRKPSSTGALVGRAVSGAACHVYQRETRFFPAAGFPAHAIEADRDLWILHPSGEPLPVLPEPLAGSQQPSPAILLLDGTWPQARELLRAMDGVGRCVRLPDDAAHEASRYWLRDQPGPAQLSTAEALMSVFTAVGETEAERRLRLHFELHVYATLLSRGKREMAERYLGHSPLLTEAPQALDHLHARGHRGPQSTSDLAQ